MKLGDIVGLGKGLFTSVYWAGKMAEMSADARFRVFLLCRKVEAVAKKRKEEARDTLLQEVETKGVKDDKGCFSLELEDGIAQKTRKVASSPDIAKVRDLLLSTKVDPKGVFVEKATVEFVVDVSVLDDLVAKGFLARQAVAACHPVSFAFNAVEKKEAKKALGDV